MFKFRSALLVGLLAASTGAFAADEKVKDGVVTTKSGLKYKDLKVGSGEEATDGKGLAVHYTGSFSDGKVFDSSIGKEPFQFQLGAAAVIKGWEEGVTGMKVGGKRLLIIPPDLAYGEKGSGKIPPNSTLHFEVELLKIEKLP